MSLRHRLKRITWLRRLVLLFRVFKNRHTFLQKAALLGVFYRDFKRYRALPVNPTFKLDPADFFYTIYDRTSLTPVDPTYFYQDSWCAGKVFAHKPARHIDVGSKADMVGIISQFTPTTMVDIRPLPLEMPGLSFVTGDILHLPFEDNSVESLSSICVIEHIGLGRYGDTLDAFGSEKSAAEFVRVLAPGGRLYISVPIDRENKIYFNAHRAFTRATALALFPSLTLKEEKYIYGSALVDSYQADKGFGTGLFFFQK